MVMNCKVMYVCMYVDVISPVIPTKIEFDK
jgi:hypothetical protein